MKKYFNGVHFLGMLCDTLVYLKWLNIILVIFFLIFHVTERISITVFFPCINNPSNAMKN